MQVGTNGYFAFEQFIGFTPFTFDGNRNISLVAPFFTDTDLSIGKGHVFYEIHTDTTSTEMFSSINSLINEHKQAQFDGKWLMVAKWEDVPPYGNLSIVRV